MARCCWALGGQLLVNLGKCVEGADRALFQRLLGNLAGVGAVMRELEARGYRVRVEAAINKDLSSKILQ